MEIVKLAALYPEMEEATIGKWLVNEGDTVEYGDPVAEFITDKVAFDYTIETSGKIIKILVENSSVVPVGVNLLVFGDEISDNELAELKAENEELLKKREAAISTFFAASGLNEAQSNTSADTKKMVRATPAARRLAKELGVELENINGTGNNGMITEDDVRASK